MNSRQRRKKRRREIGRALGAMDFHSLHYGKYKNDPRCKKAIMETRKVIPDFSHCGIANGKTWQFPYVCKNCPAREDERNE